jgi:hypothetical protein
MDGLVNQTPWDHCLRLKNCHCDQPLGDDCHLPHPIRRAHHILFHSVPLLLRRVSLSTRTVHPSPMSIAWLPAPSIHLHREPPHNLSHQGALPTQTKHPKSATSPFVCSGESDTGPSPRPGHCSAASRKSYGNPTIS